MTTANRAVAEAFSRHDFAATFDRLADAVEWRNIGGDDFRGKPAVIEACTTAAAYFETIRTAFEPFRVVDAGNTFVVQSKAAYINDRETSTVASCDIYEFADAMLTTITSYNVELLQEPSR